MRIKGEGIIVLAAAIALAVVVAACAGGGAPPTTAPAKTAATTPAPGKAEEGDPNAGKQLIVSKGCGSCHVVPGMPEAIGTVGPSLAGFAGRPQIAGTLPNNRDNVEKWLKNPPAVKPGTAMPNLGLTDKETDDLSAFLATLK